MVALRTTQEFGRAAARIAREDLGLSIEQLGEAIGKSKSAIERMQRGEANLEIGLLVLEHLTEHGARVSELPPLSPVLTMGVDFS